MNANYSIFYVKETNKLIEALISEYSNKPYTLKETLREIRSLVHQANLKADELVNQKRLEDFEVGLWLEILQTEFPNLTWLSNQTVYGVVQFKGQLGVLEIKIDYDPSYSKKWDVNTIDFGKEVYTCTEEIDRCDTLHEVLKLIKDYLFPIKSTLEKISLT